MVPETAIITFAGIRKVFVPVKEKAVERLVATGRRIDGRVEITDGLAVGDSYISNPPTNLVPGAPIRVEEGGAGGAAR
jgi:multidrug efflux pump subunit AcrA (membrane-fusion protein)